jgi:hypothetical protein
MARPERSELPTPGNRNPFTSFHCAISIGPKPRLSGSFDDLERESKMMPGIIRRDHPRHADEDEYDFMEWFQGRHGGLTTV